MIQQAVGTAAGTGRLNEAFLDIKLHQRYPLYQIPRDAVRQHCPRFGVLLTHHEPHFRRVAPPSCPAHSLKEPGDGEGRVHMERTFKPADVDAELKSCGSADGHQRIVILHVLLGALAVGSRKVAVVDEKTVGLAVHLTILPQTLAYGFTFLAGIGEDKALLPLRMLKNITYAGVGSFRRGIGGSFGNRRDGEHLLPLIGLGSGIVEMLHADTPYLLPRLERGYHRAPAAACREKLTRRLRVADSRREPYPAGFAAREPAQALD